MKILLTDECTSNLITVIDKLKTLRSGGVNSAEDLQVLTLYEPTDVLLLNAVMQRMADMQKKIDELTCKVNIVSSVDPLTGLNNRLTFHTIIKNKIADANRDSLSLALLFLNLDHFKEINDYLGYPIGDVILKEVAQRLKAIILEEDCIARLGGDEFAIIISNIETPCDAGIVAQKILNVIHPVYSCGDYEIYMGSSIGIACSLSSSSETTPEGLMQRADSALSYAKQLGRNNFQYDTSDMRDTLKKQFFLENALRIALDNKELFMCHQPVYQLGTTDLVGMEALMRWEHPKYGVISPDVFIPLAEEIGLIIPMGEWALRTVCEQAAQWYKNGHHHFKLSVNISPRQLVHPYFLTVVKLILDETQLPSGLLEFELTESSVMSTSSQIESVITALFEMNIGICLDDFGTGYSSFDHIKRLPITTLKIDKSFVMDITKHSNDALIIKSMISLSQILNIGLIAEGIETLEQLQFLIDSHCLYGQGFYLSKPLTVERMSRILKQAE
jgi:diguanylate cyclase